MYLWTPKITSRSHTNLSGPPPNRKQTYMNISVPRFVFKRILKGEEPPPACSRSPSSTAMLTRIGGVEGEMREGGEEGGGVF